MKYIIHQRTIQDLIEESEQSPKDDIIYYHKNNTIPAVQLVAQQDVAWNAKKQFSLIIRENEIYDILCKMVVQSALKRPDTSVEYDVLTNIKKQRVFIVAEITGTEIRMSEEYESNINIRDYSEDIVEFEREIDRVVLKDSWGNTDYRVTGITVFCAWHRLQKLRIILKKLVKKAIKENLAYCLRNGRVIVPQEYLDKGERGITEWQEHKRSSDKRNTMEHRMTRTLVNDKKKLLSDTLLEITRLIAIQGNDWSIPKISVNGLYNKGRMAKLANSFIKQKSAQEILELTEQDIIDMCRNYWKQKMTDTIAAMDNYKGKE